MGRQRHQRGWLPDRALPGGGVHCLHGDRDRRPERHAVRERWLDRRDRLQLPGAGLQRGGQLGLLEHGDCTSGAERVDGDSGLGDADQSGVDRQRYQRGWLPARAVQRRGLQQFFGDCHGRGWRDHLSEHRPDRGDELWLSRPGLHCGSYVGLLEPGVGHTAASAGGAIGPYGDARLRDRDRSRLDGQCDERGWFQDRSVSGGGLHQLPGNRHARGQRHHLSEHRSDRRHQLHLPGPGLQRGWQLGSLERGLRDAGDGAGRADTSHGDGDIRDADQSRVVRQLKQ